MRTLFRTTVVALLALCAVSAVPRTASADPGLGTSKWSLEFGTILGSGSNGALAIRCHSGASSAFRLGIAVNTNGFDGDGKNTITGSPDIKVTQFSESYQYALTLHWMRFAPIMNNVTGTFAVGPVVQRNGFSSRQGSNAGLPAFSEGEFGQKSTLYGLDLGLGAEWFFNHRFSLGAETGVRGLIGNSKTVQIQRSGTGPTYGKGETDIDADASQITAGDVKIRLTGYF